MSFEDGAGNTSEEELCVLEGMPVRISDNAGTYYCAHALWLVSRWAQGAPHVVVNSEGEPLVGFLHVPADPETHGAAPNGRDRFAATRAVVACALRGFLDARATSGLRVLLTGFAQFAGVVDNPTGAFAGDAAEVARTLELVRGDAATALPGAPSRVRAGALEVAHVVLPVDDKALDEQHEGSLPWLLACFRPHAVIATGVHRVVDHFRVEVRPTAHGLVLDAGAPRHGAHAGGNADALPENRALARAIAHGARALGM